MILRSGYETMSTCIFWLFDFNYINKLPKISKHFSGPLVLGPVIMFVGVSSILSISSSDASVDVELLIT